ELTVGLAAGTPTLVLSGRTHAYEGYSQREVTILVRACLALGTRTLVLTNASGGLNPAFEAGEVMLINDTINLSGDNPLVGPNLTALGPRFVPMTDAFDADLRRLARDALPQALAGAGGVIFVQQDFVTLLGIVVALVVGITCHEFSHALVADFLGDHRPRAMGRVSLNPVRHIDPLGAIFFIAAGFGWGRPVAVNAAAMRGGRRSMAW